MFFFLKKGPFHKNLITIPLLHHVREIAWQPRFLRLSGASGIHRGGRGTSGAQAAFARLFLFSILPPLLLLCPPSSVIVAGRRKRRRLLPRLRTPHRLETLVVDGSPISSMERGNSSLLSSAPIPRHPSLMAAPWKRRPMGIRVNYPFFSFSFLQKKKKNCTKHVNVAKSLSCMGNS